MWLKKELKIVAGGYIYDSGEIISAIFFLEYVYMYII